MNDHPAPGDAHAAAHGIAAAIVLAHEGHDDTVYELSGDTAWSMPELAGAIADIIGKPVTYQDLPTDQYAWH